MLDMYGLAVLHFQVAVKNRPWNEDDALWYDPDGVFVRCLTLIRRVIVGRGAGRSSEPARDADNRCAPAT